MMVKTLTPSSRAIFRSNPPSRTRRSSASLRFEGL